MLLLLMRMIGLFLCVCSIHVHLLCTRHGYLVHRKLDTSTSSPAARSVSTTSTAIWAFVSPTNNFRFTLIDWPRMLRTCVRSSFFSVISFIMWITKSCVVRVFLSVCYLPELLEWHHDVRTICSSINSENCWCIATKFIKANTIVTFPLLFSNQILIFEH